MPDYLGPTATKLINEGLELLPPHAKIKFLSALGQGGEGGVECGEERREVPTCFIILY